MLSLLFDNAPTRFFIEQVGPAASALPYLLVALALIFGLFGILLGYKRRVRFLRRIGNLIVGVCTLPFRPVPRLLDGFYRFNSDPLLRGDRLAYAKELLPPASYPPAWRTDVPEDLQKPLWHDGRLVTGQMVSHLADAQFSDRTFADALGKAAAYAVCLVAFAIVLVFLTVGSMLSGTGGGDDYPYWAEIDGLWLPIVAWYAVRFLEWVWFATVGLVVLAVPVLLFLAATSFFLFLRVIDSWWRDTALPYFVPTRDSLLYWKRNASVRPHQLKVYSRMVEEATGRLADQPFLPVGQATGILRSRGDDNAPVAGVTVGFDGESVRTHTLVLGGTGTGKTRLVIRPLFKRIMSAKWGEGHRIGSYVTDGKGTLWRDLAPAIADRTDVVVLGTAEGHYGVNLLQGMSPLEVATTFKAVGGQVSGAGGGDDFWPESASLLLMHCAMLAFALEQDETAVAEWVQERSFRPYSLLGVAKLATDHTVLEEAFDQVRAAALRAAERELGEAEVDPFMRAYASIEWIEGSFLPMANETKSSIVANVNVVLGKLQGAPDLTDRFCRGTFARTADVDHALTGGVCLVAVGETDHGLAGKVVNVWLKSRLYILARRRLLTDPEGCRQTSCAMIADEFQMLATVGPDSDSSFWNVARETGVFLIAATQSLAALKQAIGDDATANLTNLLRSKIVLRTEEVSTLEYLTKIAGKTTVANDAAKRLFANQTARAAAYGEAEAFIPRIWKFGPSALVPFEISLRREPHLITDSSTDPFRDALHFFKERRGSEGMDPKLAEAERKAITDGERQADKVTVDDLLLGSGMAFAMIQRAGGTRADVIDLQALA